MTTAELIDQIVKAGKLANLELDNEGAEKLVDAFAEIVSRELSVGEEVEVKDLGEFSTVKLPSQTQGEKITLPTIEVEYEPDAALVKYIQEQIAAHPDLFTTDTEEDEEEEDDEDKGEAKEEASADKPDLPDMPDEEDEKDKDESKPVVDIESGDTHSTEGPKEEPEESKKEGDEEKEPKEKEGWKASSVRVSNIEFIDTTSLKVEREVLMLLPQALAKQYRAVPLDLKEGTLTVGMIDPEDFDALQIIRKETGLSIKPALTTRDGLNAILDQYTGLQAEVQEVINNSDLGITKKEIEQASEEDVQSQDSEHAPTVHIVYSLLKRAVKEKASDVHIEPYENRVVVRFREDGVLSQKLELPSEIESAIVARLKILARLKIDEQRLPQDGRFSLIIDKRQIDFRLSTIPVVYGEKVVMRILDKSVGIIALEDVGLIGNSFDTLTKNLKRSHGMVLVTGPTGSGKTTTLYAVLGRMMSPDVNILTLEDPVEYRVDSINQSQVHTEIGYTFATGLRAVVRQDPDIVMLGEIRDPETADMAIHAALTGHIVLSTLHTNDAAGAFPRLIDMGIEPFLLTSSVHTVVAQRLARKICPDCKEEIKIAKEEWDEVEANIAAMPEEVQKEIGKERTLYHGKGCDTCGGKGYQGRIGVFEVLNVSESIRSMVLKRVSGDEITAQAIKEGMVTMVQDGIIKALKGMTTLEEVWRVTRE